MTGIVALSAPVAAAAVAVGLRRRLGVWASWLFLASLATVLLLVGVGQPWWAWGHFLSELDEDVGIATAAFAMGVVVQALGARQRPAVQVAAASLAALTVEWIVARLEVQWLAQALVGALVVAFVGLQAQAGWHWWQRRRARVPEA